MRIDFKTGPEKTGKAQRALVRSKFILSIVLLTLGAAEPKAIESTWVYAVQISASVQTSPAQITLQWEPDQYGANSYTIYRKSKDATSWGAGTTLPGWTTSWTDYNVAAAGAYEYQIVKAAALGYTGYGYIFAGIEAPLVESRGKIILIVANTYAADLVTELARLQSDLIGDGWQVIRHDVSSTDSPASVRGLIIADYNADPTSVNAVLLFGHVPIRFSGNLNYDTHLARPMPADAYYADIDGDWSSNPDYLPSDAELMVGRVDLWNLPGVGSSVPWPSEKELLRNYLNKNHAWRHKLISVPRRALMGNRRGDELGEATAATGYRNFEPLVGPGNTVEANIADNAPPPQRWVSMLDSDAYLWAYGCGGGDYTGLSGLGTNGQYYFAYSKDVVGPDAKAVFVMVFGSWLGNWESSDNFMRSFLATPTMGLACCMGGEPHWFAHHMGLGETIGYTTRLTLNNSTLYRNQSNSFPRAIYISLMGDPSLRMDPVDPPKNLSAIHNVGNSVNLNWQASGDSIVGYHVYRAPSASGPFTRLTSSLVAGTSYTDLASPSGDSTYMVRAVKLQSTPSGTYFNPSQGVFAPVTVSNTAAPIYVGIFPATNAMVLNWNSAAGATYRVLAKTNFEDAIWTDLSGNIVATGTNCSWTDINFSLAPQRLYRVISP
jgi:hypothetical protein